MKPVRSSHTSCLFEHTGGARPAAATALVVSALSILMALTSGCASRPDPRAASQGADPLAAGAQDDEASSPFNRPVGADAQRLVGQDLATRHALFKVSAFDSLPGWQQDNMGEAWAAFRESCRALEKKPNWKPLCTRVKTIQDPKAGRAFLEREFALLTVQNTDRSRDGEITGYYEPLLQGRARREGRFGVPVYGVPNDLYILDWKQVPANLRKGVAHVRASGRLLTLTQADQPGAIRIDLRRFNPDTLDRRLRVRIQGNEAMPYLSRADIGRQGGALDAPVLAWVDDPIALYAMQVQGTGRIRMADGTVLRLQYADQNGHPFKPMQLAAQGNERVQTRGAGVSDDEADIEHFELADEAVSAVDALPDEAQEGELVTRGGRKPIALTGGVVTSSASASGGGAGSGAAAGGEVEAAVNALTPKPGARAASSGNVLNIAGRPAGKSAPAGANPTGQSSQSQSMVDDLLTQAQQGGRKAGAGKADKAAAQAAARAGQRATPGAPANNDAVAGAVAALSPQRQRALDADPSYVFFRVAPDQSKEAGPVGALGVPLTAGRSLAVDPRVLPLGYPVFLDAATGGRREPHMQRLMFAQDTGGAIRGAVRADYFWGFGADAGKQARRTKQKGRMWVLVPHAEVQSLLSSKLVTRGASSSTAVLDTECLITDENYCE